MYAILVLNPDIRKYFLRHFLPKTPPICTTNADRHVVRVGVCRGSEPSSPDVGIEYEPRQPMSGFVGVHDSRHVGLPRVGIEQKPRHILSGFVGIRRLTVAVADHTGFM